jgi:putative ABC transport system permease protein
MAPDAYPRLLDAAAPMSINYSYRYFTDTDAFDAGALDGLASDIRRLDAEYPSSGLSRPEETSVRTGLSNIFRRYLSQRALTESILSLATIGLLAVALAVIGLVAALIAERRRDLYHIVRSRGASSAQLIAAQIAEGLLLTVPPALVGFLLATVLLDARPSQLSRDATAVIVIATVVLLVVASLPFARRSLLTIERADVVVGRPSARRLVLEGLIVAVALIGVYLIRRRGLSADSSAEEVGGFDVYLAAVPVLLSLATGVLVLRLYPLPLRLFAWIASLRRDLIPSLGFRRVARQPSVISAPLLVLVLAVAVGVFSSVLLYSIDQGQLRTSWQTVGADYRVDSFQGTPLYRGIDMTAVDEVDGIAPASLLPDIPLVVTQPVFGRVSLLAVDTPAYQDVAGGTPADPHLPNALLRDPAGQDFGTPSNPIPAIVSTRWVSTGGIGTGDTFTLDISGLEVSFVVSQLRETFPGIEIGNAFVVTDLRAIQAMVPERPMRPNRLYLNAPDDALETIDETLASQSPSAQLTSRAAEYNEVHEAPLIAGVARGFRVGVVVAAAYSALAVAVALALTARARARDLAFLRTLGLSERQVLGLVVVEQAPPVAVALGVGLVLGVAIARLVEPGLDLTAFTGPGVPIELVIDTSTLVLISASIVAVVTAAIAVVTIAAQRANLGSALRLGDD